MKKGFTLMELLAVIVIISIIATAVGVSYTTISKNHKDNVCRNLEDSIKNAVVEFMQDRDDLMRSGSSYLRVWQTINDTETVDRYGNTSWLLVDYTPSEVAKITEKNYSDIKNYIILVNRNNGNYSATMKTAPSGSVVSLCD